MNLNTIYTDPRNPAGLSSIKKLYAEAKKTDPTITYQSVKDWLQGQFVYTLHHPARRYWQRNKIVVSAPHVQGQVDLCDMRSLSSANEGYNYILSFIDSFSRFALARPVRMKRKEDVTAALESILDEYHVQNVISDRGNEFKNELCRSMLARRGIFQYFTINQDIKCAIVERFNRTLKSRMFRYFTLKGTRRWIDVLDDLLYAYNHAIHRSILIAPADVTSENSGEIFKHLYNGYENERSLINDVLTRPLDDAEYEVNEIVRLRFYLPLMEHRYYPNYDDRYFRIASIVRGFPRTRYKLKLWEDDSPIKGSFYPEELQPVKHGEYRVKVVGETGRGSRRKVLLHFLGYPEKYDQWQLASTVRHLFE